jgi:hypothetical protein
MIARVFVIVLPSFCIALSALAYDGPYVSDDATILLAHLDGDAARSELGY